MELSSDETNRKIHVFVHAKLSGNIALTCHYYGVTRQVFYKWQRNFLKDGIEGLKSKKPGPTRHPRRT
jgi:hypothetical protein